MGTQLFKDKWFLNTNGIIAIQKELEENNAGLRKLTGTAFSVTPQLFDLIR
jgi:hypothetical protein